MTADDADPHVLTWKVVDHRSRHSEDDVRRLSVRTNEAVTPRPIVIMVEDRRQAEAAWSETQKLAKAALKSLVEDLSVIRERTGTGAGLFGIHLLCDKPWSATRLAKITKVAELVHAARIESERKLGSAPRRGVPDPAQGGVVTKPTEYHHEGKTALTVRLINPDTRRWKIEDVTPLSREFEATMRETAARKAARRGRPVFDWQLPDPSAAANLRRSSPVEVPDWQLDATLLLWLRKTPAQARQLLNRIRRDWPAIPRPRQGKL